MNRLPRGIHGNGFFHVMVQGINREYIFDKEKFKEKYFNLIINMEKKHQISLLAYCIMDNHAHLLIYTNNIEELSAYMKSINCRFAKFYNKEKERVGYVFRDRFNSQYINNKNYLLRCLNYIHMNPIHAEMVTKPEQYIYSSYNDYINKTNNISDDKIKLIFGNIKDYLYIFLNISNNDFEIMDIDRDNKNFDIAANLYLARNEISLNDLKNDDKYLKDFCNEIIVKKGYKQNQVADLLQISKTKVCKLLKNIETKKSV